MRAIVGFERELAQTLMELSVHFPPKCEVDRSSLKHPSAGEKMWFESNYVAERCITYEYRCLSYLTMTGIIGGIANKSGEFLLRLDCDRECQLYTSSEKA